MLNTIDLHIFLLYSFAALLCTIALPSYIVSLHCSSFPPFNIVAFARCIVAYRTCCSAASSLDRGRQQICLPDVVYWPWRHSMSAISFNLYPLGKPSGLVKHHCHNSFSPLHLLKHMSTHTTTPIQCTNLDYTRDIYSIHSQPLLRLCNKICRQHVGCRWILT